MQISVYIQWAHRNKALRDDPNETFAVFYYWLLIDYHWRQAVCPTDFSPIQQLPENINDLFLLFGGDFRSRVRQQNRSCFTDVHFWTWIDANFYNPDNNSWNLFNCKCNPFKVKLNYKHLMRDQLCGDFRTHESMQIRDTKWMFAYFYNPDNNSWNLFNCKCNPFKVKLNYKHWEINFVVTLGPKAEPLAINFVCKLVFW